MLSHMSDTITIFISYSHADAAYLESDSLFGFLKGLEKDAIEFWTDGEIQAGELWDSTIQNQISRADLALMLVSQAFLDSEYCRNVEVQQFLQKQTHIFPVLLSPCDWKRHDWLKNRQCLPGDDQTIEEHYQDPGDNKRLLLQIREQLLTRSEQIRQHRSVQVKTQRQAELAWLTILEQQLPPPYIPLQGISRQSGISHINIPQDAVQHGILEHMAQRLAKEIPEKICDYTDIQTAFTQVSRAVLLGEPGAGKSTALRKLAHDALAVARQHNQAPIPLLIPLGQWRDAQQSFADYLQSCIGSLKPWLNTLLQEQRIWLLLDGLNEPPSDQRADKAAQLRSWLKGHPQLLCCISCRDLDYGDNALNLGLDRICIRPLNPLRIRDFLKDYLPRLLKDTAGAEASAEALFWELGGGDGLRKTWEVWQQAGASERQFWLGDEIPRDEPDVYHKTTFLQDEQWRDAIHSSYSLLKLAANPFMLSMLALIYASKGMLPGNRSVLFGLFLETLLERENLLEQKANLLSGLQALAWGMQAVRDSSTVSSVQTTLSRPQALQHIDETSLRLSISANLLDAGDDVRFSHQLLQEYFTALTMRQRLLAGALDATTIWPPQTFWKPSGWEEAVVLLAGLFEDDCTPLLEWLLPIHPEMVSRCIESSGAGFDDGILEALQARWHPAITDINTWPEPEARASIARALGNLNLDQRSGVGVTDAGWPDIDWRMIPAGEVTLQEDAGRFPVKSFYLARYPVTHAQFQAFIDDPNGYANPHWWHGLDEQPGTPESPHWKAANHPRETVSWFEAMAFCAWLSERLGYAIQLPTEWQWQQAACSGHASFEYPWEGEYKSGYANINETRENTGPHNLGRTSAVGIYPRGDSKQGVSDLCGNVWEWCLNEYQKPSNVLTTGNEWRVVRGGSWFLLGDARASFRYDVVPGSRNGVLGFRLCCFSPI